MRTIGSNAKHINACQMDKIRVMHSQNYGTGFAKLDF